jgi:hypothetical protein
MVSVFPTLFAGMGLAVPPGLDGAASGEVLPGAAGGGVMESLEGAATAQAAEGPTPEEEEELRRRLEGLGYLA